MKKVFMEKEEETTKYKSEKKTNELMASFSS